LTELQRVQAIATSNTTGGDGTPNVIDMLGGAILDIATAPSPTTKNIPLIEHNDVLIPSLESVSLNYSTGVIVFTFSETIDFTPITKFLLNSMFLSNLTTEELIPLTGVTNSDRFDVLDATNISMTMTEKQRVDILRFAGVNGGDGTAAYFVARSGSFRDIGENLNSFTALEVNETEDTIIPRITQSVLNLSLGILTIRPSETLEMSTIVQNRFFLSNASNAKTISLSGSDILSDDEGVTFTIILTELQRADAIHLSSTSGGDGTPILLDIEADGFRDRATNPCLDLSGLSIVEQADTKVPNVTGATVFLDNGTVIIYFSEYIDVTPRSYVNLSKILFTNVSQDDALAVPFTGGKIINDDFTHIEILLTEEQRIKTVEISSQPGGDSTNLILDVAAGAIRDRAQNFNIDQFGIVVFEYPDVIPPRLISAKLFFDDGVLELNASEWIDTTPASQISLDKLFLANNSYELGFDLVGSTVAMVDGYKVNITLPEVKRANALKQSGTIGGDRHALFLKAFDGSIFDIAQNPSVQNFTLPIEEFDDKTRPTFYNGTLDYNDGTLLMLLSETIDVTPSSRVNLSKFYVSNISLSNDVALHGAAITENDLTLLTITLTEDMRAATVYNSGTPGGDNGANVIDIYDFGILDLAENPSHSFLNQVLQEIPDTTKPTIMSGHINYDNRVITVNASEYIDATPGIIVNVSKLHLSNITGERTLNLGDASYGVAVVTELDGVYINITIAEPMRIDAIPLSGTPGGDHGRIVLDIDEGAFIDLSGNTILDQPNIVLSEFPDISPPSITAATLHLGTGVLEIFADETIDLSPLSRVNLSKMHIANNTGDGFFIFPNEASRITGIIGRNGKIDGVTFNISYTDRERVKFIAASNTPGGDQTTLVLDAFSGFVHDIGLKDNLDNLDIVITEMPDTIPPTIGTATLNLTDGVLVITTSEIIDTTPISRVNLSKIILGNLTEPDVSGDVALIYSEVTADDNFKLVLRLRELDRVRAIQISNTDGGDYGTAFISFLKGAFYDIGRNDNVEKLYLPLVEIEDSLRPTIFSVSLNYSTGVIVINASETIDSTPRTLVDTAKILLYNDNVNDALTVLNSNVFEVDELHVTILLTEEQRALGIKRSSTPGGDGSALSVKLNVNAIQDIAQNGNSETNLILIEHDDIVHPVPLVVIVNFTHGTMTLNFSETILAEQTTQYNLSNVYFANITGQKDISIGDSIAEISFL
jgi:hypothetical protein